MHPRFFAESHPEKPAMVMADSGASISYKELEEAANCGAHAMRALGVNAGDTIAFWLKNSLEFLVLYWAGQRAGALMTPVPTHSSEIEAAHILNDSGAKLLITAGNIGAASAFFRNVETLAPGVNNIFSVNVSIPGVRSWNEFTKEQPMTPIADEVAGFHLLYSSGTTGKPKGIKLPFAGGEVTAPNFWVERNKRRYDLTADSIYLSPAPLYHASPLLFSVTAQRMGSTVVILPKFSPEAALKAIAQYRVTYTQMVPTMFVRLLRMPVEERLAYDVSTLTHVVHTAAPCPAHVKKAMMEWLGEIVYEHYGGSEANGATSITPGEWLQRPGSVGRADRGILHICNEAGDELPPGENGVVYFEGASVFEYLNDPEKTRNARHPHKSDWTTIGDIGRVDEEGYLYLTDRKGFVIISGGVNIYPREIEDVLIEHNSVADVAVFGVPHEDLGEEVKAVIQPVSWSDASDDLAALLIQFCRDRLSPVKCPKSIDFQKTLPRQDNGKLYKKKIRDRYWEKENAG